MLDVGDVRTRAELAARVGVTAARVSQVLELLRLDPRILGWIQSLAPGTPKRVASERGLRAVARLPGAEQIRVLSQRSSRAAVAFEGQPALSRGAAKAP